MGTGSLFTLYSDSDFYDDQDVFDNSNFMTIVPSLGQSEEGATLYTKMSKKDLGEDW
jgi:hypothetical protein